MSLTTFGERPRRADAPAASESAQPNSYCPNEASSGRSIRMSDISTSFPSTRNRISVRPIPLCRARLHAGRFERSWLCGWQCVRANTVCTNTRVPKLIEDTGRDASATGRRNRPTARARGRVLRTHQFYRCRAVKVEARLRVARVSASRHPFSTEEDRHHEAHHRLAARPRGQADARRRLDLPGRAGAPGRHRRRGAPDLQRPRLPDLAEVHGRTRWSTRPRWASTGSSSSATGCSAASWPSWRSSPSSRSSSSTARARDLFWLALVAGLGVPFQAILGGITVLTGLTWWVVGMHFVTSIVAGRAHHVVPGARLRGARPARARGSGMVRRRRLDHERRRPGHDRRRASSRPAPDRTRATRRRRAAG